MDDTNDSNTVAELLRIGLRGDCCLKVNAVLCAGNSNSPGMCLIWSLQAATADRHLGLYNGKKA